MDDKWFKLQQKKAGVTAEDIAARLGKDRSLVSRIYVGRQKMTFDQAKVFAEILNASLADVLLKAGLADETSANRSQTNVTFGDVSVWRQTGAENRNIPAIAAAMGQRPGVEVWQVRSAVLALMGYLPGDFLLVDTNAAERARAGDVVIAQVHDNARSSATLVLRRNEPPVLVAASSAPQEGRVFVVDGTNVVIKGKIIGSWRVPTPGI